MRTYEDMQNIRARYNIVIFRDRNKFLILTRYKNKKKIRNIFKVRGVGWKETKKGKKNSTKNPFDSYTRGYTLNEITQRTMKREENASKQEKEINKYSISWFTAKTRSTRIFPNPNFVFSRVLLDPSEI